MEPHLEPKWFAKRIVLPSSAPLWNFYLLVCHENRRPLFYHESLSIFWLDLLALRCITWWLLVCNRILSSVCCTNLYSEVTSIKCLSKTTSGILPLQFSSACTWPLNDCVGIETFNAYTNLSSTSLNFLRWS